MSLAVWLPLNGDLHNQGLNNTNIINTNATLNDNGKIGKCYNFNGSNSYIKGNTFLNNNSTAFSFSCWVNFNSISGTQCLFSNRTATSESGFSIFYTSGAGFYFDSGSRWSFTSPVSISANKWYHFCFTWEKNKNENKKYYCNGELKNTTTSNVIPSTANATYFSIGGSQSNRNGDGTSNFLNAKINDVRIYDHCLSPKEVEEISKGLVLHYPLNNNGLGNTNLALNTKNLNIDGDISNLYMFKKGNATRQLRTDAFSEIKCTNSWQGIQVYANALNLSAGSKLTYSFYIYGNENSKKFYFYPMIYSSEGVRDTTTKIPISIDGSSYVSANSKLFTSTTTTTPKHHYVTFEWTQDLVDIIDNEGYILLTIQVYGTWDTGDWSCIFSPKLEFGEIPTPWAPAPSDIGYTNVIYDTSGYCNNGTIVGDIATIAPSPRYNCCIEHLDSCADYIYREYLSFLGDSGFTFSCWINPSNYSRTNNGTYGVGNQYILSQGRDIITSGTDHTYGASLTMNNGKIFFVCGSGSLYSNTTVSLGEWAHIVGVWTGTQKKIYINGVLKNSANDNKIDWSEAQNSLVIGKMAYGKSSSTAHHPFVGKISDVRIYATALTDSQIKELYNTSMQIDSSGNVFARELVEL